MSFKKEFIKKLSNDDSILEYRYKSISVIFLLSVLIFALSFFFIGAKFHMDFFVSIFTFCYVFFVISLSFGFFYLMKYSFKNQLNKFVVFFFGLLSFLACVVLLLPVTFSRETLTDFLHTYL